MLATYLVGIVVRIQVGSFVILQMGPESGPSLVLLVVAAVSSSFSPSPSSSASGSEWGWPWDRLWMAGTCPAGRTAAATCPQRRSKAGASGFAFDDSPGTAENKTINENCWLQKVQRVGSTKIIYCIIIKEECDTFC